MTEIPPRERVEYIDDADLPRRRETTVIEEEVVDNYEPMLTPRQKMYKFDQVLWLLLGMLETLIGMRVFLKLIAANPASGFANFIYNLSAPFLAPFFGLTQTPAANGVVLEIPSIIAMIVYALLFWFASYIVHVFWERP